MSNREIMTILGSCYETNTGSIPTYSSVKITEKCCLKYERSLSGQENWHCTRNTYAQTPGLNEENQIFLLVSSKSQPKSSMPKPGNQYAAILRPTQT